ncbi:DedA family protein [Agarivorans sp. TSD2052]|uniref:DedA family protein n=1 Tax=Agarivorans sp. TSD2052 TaxID=2937286 RepID=UPI0020102EFE|nr:DedA family protein [Agarivorans sp. TSD2052]UPW16731.1 DedA family protein [Agarivorans sp. TSD2052]
MLDILYAIWHHDYETLLHINSLNWLLLVLALVLFLESSFVFLPLPGDSLVLFVGGLIGMGILDFYPAIAALCLSSSLGCICAYSQGRLLQKTSLLLFVERVLPEKALPKTKYLLSKYGFLSLFVSRFIPFVRVLTPMLMGISKLGFWKTVLASTASSLIWSILLLMLGKWLMLNPVLSDNQQLVTQAIVMISLALMIIGTVGGLFRLLANKHRSHVN